MSSEAPPIGGDEVQPETRDFLSTQFVFGEGGSQRPAVGLDVLVTKVAVDFAKTHDKFEIVGGAMGETVLDVNGIKALAALPSLDELRATIVGLIQAPATKIARTINEPGAMLARVIGAYAAKENA